MNAILRTLLAQMESWEAANEFGIAEVDWADYDARARANDVYIASLCEIYDTFRIEDYNERIGVFDSLAKTLLIYSRSAAARYLHGVEANLNLLYCAALYYLGQRPATGMFVSRGIQSNDAFNDEENFLLRLLSRTPPIGDDLDALLRKTIDSPDDITFQSLDNHLLQRIEQGLRSEPRQYLAAILCRQAVWQFRHFNIWNQLRLNASGYDRSVWDTLLNAKGTFPLWELLPSQLAALEAGLLRDDVDTVSLQMPTSSGKTSLCELLIFQEVKVRQRRVLFLVPFRALAAEIHSGICSRLQQADITILASYGGNVPTRSEAASTETADVLITTPEKFTALIQAVPEIEKAFRTVICDEGHLIDDASRGLQYELLLTRLRAESAGPKRFVFMSAIIPNVGDIHAWLGGTPESLAVSGYKPVSVDYAFLKTKKNSWQLDVNPIYKPPRRFFLSRFLVKDDFRYLNTETKRLNLLGGYKTNLSLACAAALKARETGPVALFTTTRGGQGINGLSEKMVEMLDCQARVAQSSGKGERTELTEYLEFLFGRNHLLPRLTKWKIGFHHGQLPQEVRRVMEEALENGTITLLLCTTTLAEGVNLPIRTLVVHTVRRFDQAENALVYIKNRSIKNIIGRAGRGKWGQ